MKKNKKSQDKEEIKNLKQEKKRLKKEKKKKSKIRKVIKILFILILLGIIAYGGWFYYKMQKNGGGLSGFLQTAVGQDEETKKNLGTINILLLGESGIGDGYKLADSIMVCSYNPKTQSAAILSIPRDTYVGRKDKKSASQNYLMSYKMNAMYRNGTNIPETLELVSQLIGIQLDYYVLVDTDAVIKVVDAIGGVTFNVPIDMDYDDNKQGLHIHLKAGEQLIDGDKAEQLLRFRHNQDGTSYPKEYGDNDLGRMRTQREFIQETIKQLLQFKNIFKLKELVDIGFESIKTNIDIDTIKDYIPYAVDFNVNNLKMETLPGKSEKCNGIWIYTMNKTEGKKVVDELFTNNTLKETEDETESTKVELLNGTNNEEYLSKVKEKLETHGYTVTKTGNTTNTSKTTIINRTNQSVIIEEDIMQLLGVGTISSTSNDSTVDFTIIIGKDYE